ncbi:helix-turn-helix domain-containing protein [Caulobacter sp. FWC2]|uniref:helix-turn-helix domain-containing protein n=1 Tax=Caulobacter sp. FWC2 TaxID=69664 RepID=UPI0013046924|nr:AraC family transcriptional regulator [Caulobacter sp. FWC2]
MSTLGLSLNSAGAAPFSAGPMAQALLDMLGRAERALEIDPRQARVFLGQASRLLEPAADSAQARDAGLAPWQERKVLRHIGDHLDRSISNHELAEVVGLSISHFSRRFKASFGIPPRDYLIRSRVERAKTLMLDPDASLCQIALDCGFCDQAHLSRLFQAVAGVTPSRWRRQHINAAAA